MGNAGVEGRGVERMGAKRIGIAGAMRNGANGVQRSGLFWIRRTGLDGRGEERRAQVAIGAVAQARCGIVG